MRVDNPSALASIFSIARTGLRALPSNMAGSIAGSSFANGTERACPLVLAQQAALDRIGVQVTTGASTSVVRLGIRTQRTDGTPGSLLLDAGTIDASTSGFKEITIAITLPAGLYWLTSAVQTADCSLDGYSATQVGIGLPTDSATPPSSPIGSGYRNSATVSGALPASFTFGGTANPCPVVCVRFA